MTFAHFVKLIIIDIVYFSETCHIKHHWFSTDVVLNYYNIVAYLNTTLASWWQKKRDRQHDRWRVLIKRLHVYEFCVRRKAHLDGLIITNELDVDKIGLTDRGFPFGASARWFSSNLIDLLDRNSRLYGQANKNEVMHARYKVFCFVSSSEREQSHLLWRMLSRSLRHTWLPSKTLWEDGRTDGRTDGRKDGWMTGQFDYHSSDWEAGQRDVLAYCVDDIFDLVTSGPFSHYLGTKVKSMRALYHRQSRESGVLSDLQRADKSFSLINQHVANVCVLNW